MYDSKFFPDVDKQIISGDKISYKGILVASKFNQKNGQDYPLLDLVDIDFNGAWISSMNTYLKTSYDLIYVLDALNQSSKISDLAIEIQKIWNQINEITSTYITYSSLDEILQEGWQRKLIAGDYIKIDESDSYAYTIYAYGLPTYEYLYETYTSLTRFNAFETYIGENYYNKQGTYNVAYQAAYDAIQRVIDGADNAFDTLKEISDWILDQDRYTPIPWGDVVNDWKEEYYYVQIMDPETGEGTGKYELIDSPDIEIIEISDPEMISREWKEDYYFYLREDGKYMPVTNPDFVDYTGETKYYFCPTQHYIKENYLTDIQNLIKRVNRLDDSVGFKEWDEFTYSYSYSGHYKDIYDIQIKNYQQDLNIDNLFTKTEQIERKADTAYSFAYTAYGIAYTAYGIAYNALETSWDATDRANLAYEMAYIATVKVGDPTISEGYDIIESSELLEQYKNDGILIFEQNEDGDFVLAIEPFDDNKIYYTWHDKTPGTGLTGRVEVAEQKADEALERSEVALYSSYESLYYLNVNNSESTYVNLSLAPQSFDGDRRRTINIKTDNASIDSQTGEIYSHGIVGINTAMDIYTYASSWMMLFVENDYNWPEDGEEFPEVDVFGNPINNE